MLLQATSVICSKFIRIYKALYLYKKPHQLGGAFFFIFLLKLEKYK